MANNAMEQRNRALLICEQNGVGVIAMKPFGGGRLLMEGSVSFAGYHRGGKGLKKKISDPISPIQCLHYVLSQPGVNVVLPGVKNIEELNGVLGYLKATTEERDYSEVLKSFNEYKKESVFFVITVPRVLRELILEKFSDTITLQWLQIYLLLNLHMVN